MADVVQLKSHEAPPQDEDCVVVTKLPSGRFEISAVLQLDGTGVTFWNSAPLEQPLRTVVHMAGQYADRHGVPVIYVIATD